MKPYVSATDGRGGSRKSDQRMFQNHFVENCWPGHSWGEEKKMHLGQSAFDSTFFLKRLFYVTQPRQKLLEAIYETMSFYHQRI